MAKVQQHRGWQMRALIFAMLLALAACTSEPVASIPEAPPPVTEKSTAAIPQECGAIPCANPKPTPPSARRPPLPEAEKSPDTKASNALTDAQVRQRMIMESIALYSGSCPCPYNTKSNGASCGGGSAWSKPGGEDPLCYDSDISDEDVSYRKENKIPKAEEPRVF